MNTRHAVVRVEELGDLTIVAAGDAVTGIYFPGHWTLPDPAGFGQRVELEDDPLLAEAAGQLRDFATRRRDTFDLPTATAGTAFEERVWSRLRKIPFGETTTYGEIAAELGDPSLARRVGQAVGANPLSIVVPCHRVVGKDGRLTGYAGGLERKRFLLERETPNLFSLEAAASRARVPAQAAQPA